MNPARRSSITVLALLTFAMAALRFVTGAFGEDAPKPTVATGSKEAQQRRPNPPFAKGTLESVDLLRHQLKLKIGDNVRAFTYTTNTYIFRGKEKITADGLKKGEVIALRVYTDPEGRVLVRRIKAYGPAQPAGSESSGPAEPPK
jgi:hypothetical protein